MVHPVSLLYVLVAVLTGSRVLCVSEQGEAPHTAAGAARVEGPQLQAVPLNVRRCGAGSGCVRDEVVTVSTEPEDDACCSVDKHRSRG